MLAAWDRLGEEHRVVLSMHDIEDYSLPELAQIMDVPVGTLKSRPASRAGEAEGTAGNGTNVVPGSCMKRA